jgi:ketosteroid isomerase-like protein
MRFFARSLVTVAVLAMLAGLCAAQGGEVALLQADRDFNQATGERGLEGWMAFMADDAVLLRGKPVTGKEAVRESMKEQFADAASQLVWEPKYAQLFNSGKMGYTSGRWTFTGVGEKKEKITVQGDYLTVWQKQADGSWKVIYDGGTSDPRPAKN